MTKLCVVVDGFYRVFILYCYNNHQITVNIIKPHVLVVQRTGSTLISSNEVNLCWVWVVLGWVTINKFNSQYQTFTSGCNQPPRSTQPGHPFVTLKPYLSTLTGH